MDSVVEEHVLLEQLAYDNFNACALACLDVGLRVIDLHLFTEVERVHRHREVNIRKRH